MSPIIVVVAFHVLRPPPPRSKKGVIIGMKRGKQRDDTLLGVERLGEEQN
jgi:hypothetical protein